jgi:hypothetical protein
MIRLGFGIRPVANHLMLEFPGSHIDDVMAIIQLASESCAAASLYKDMPADQRPTLTDIPSLPE